MLADVMLHIARKLWSHCQTYVADTGSPEVAAPAFQEGMGRWRSGSVRWRVGGVSSSQPDKLACCRRWSRQQVTQWTAPYFARLSFTDEALGACDHSGTAAL